MFNYPNLKPANIKTAEQFCTGCNKWYKLPADAIAKLQSDWTASAKKPDTLLPFRTCVCTHCDTEQIAVMVGKYDKPNTPKRRCSVQCITTG